MMDRTIKMKREAEKKIPVYCRYYRPLLWLIGLGLVAPFADSPVDWWRVLEISTSLVIISLLLEFDFYYRARIKANQAVVITKPWIIDLLVASYAMLMAAATVQVILFLASDNPLTPLLALVTVSQITSLMWLLPMINYMEQEHRGRK